MLGVCGKDSVVCGLADHAVAQNLNNKCLTHDYDTEKKASAGQSSRSWLNRCYGNCYGEESDVIVGGVVADDLLGIG